MTMLPVTATGTPVKKSGHRIVGEGRGWRLRRRHEFSVGHNPSEALVGLRDTAFVVLA